ncbi:MAG TPA: PAS domain S-box protein [Geothrix sp.]|jgi:PAS domain S-box-containing protein
MQPPREPQDPAEALALVRRYLGATYRIAQAALDNTDLQELFGRVHAIVRDLMPAENLYFALWDRPTGTVSFPYFVDALDPVPPPRTLGRGLTEYVLRTEQPLLLDREVLKTLESSGEVAPIGTDSLDWLGVPLEGTQGVFGVLAIQIYAGNRRYTPEERDLLVFVSGQVAMAIERKRAEANHRMMARTIDQTRDSVFGLNAAGRVVFVNEAACRELGYDRETLLGLSLSDIDSKFPMDQWPAFMATLREQGTSFVETEHRRKDGSTLPVEISVCHLTHEGQDLAFGYARDITDRRVAEQALRLSEEKFSKAFQASPDAININQLDGTYQEVNETFTRLSGWTRDETLGRTTVEMGLWVNPEDRVRAMEMIKQDGHFDGLEAPFRMKDGSIRMGLLSGTLIQVDGQPCMLSITRDITERKRVEAALRRSEDKFSRAFHASPDAINLTLLKDGTYLDVSEGFMRLTGWTPEEALGRSALELGIWVNPEDRARAIHLIQEHGEFTGLEAPFRRKDGTILTGLMSGKAMEVDGMPCLLSITRDITDRKAAEQALRSTERRLRTVLAYSQAIIFQLDPEGRFTLSEGLGLAKIGLRPGEAVGRSALEMYGADSVVVDQIRQGMQGQASHETTRTHGRIFNNLLTPVFDDQGKVESLIGIATDITERQLAEEALLTERGLFVGGPVMVFKWRAEPGWPTDYASPNVETILGHAIADLLEGRISYESLIHPEDLPRVLEEISVHLGQGRMQFEQQYRLRTARGDYRWFYDFSAAAGQGSTPSHFLGYLLDITERRQAEEALRQAQKLESLGVLAGGIAHDFNNLLTVVIGNLNLAQLQLQDTSPAQPYLTNMEATVLRAAELTKQMLAYSGRGHFQVKPHDLNAVVRDLTHLLEVSISKKVHLQFDLEPHLPAIQADVAQLQQVVMNLVTNASDAIGDQDGAIHISTSAESLDEKTLRSEYRLEAPVPGLHVVLEVEDTGSGMTAEVMERIFDPFFTTKATGRGLGLSAMLGILRGHGAGLNIASTVDRGSRFRLCFPAVGGAAIPAAQEAPSMGPAPLHGLVLLVDDEDQIIKTTGLALEALGFQAVMARDGVEALERFQEHRSDLRLVLMDLTMPRMDGREAFQAMRNLDPAIPVVLSSGFTEQDALQTFPDGGPAAFLQKPYQLKDLRAVIQRALGN